VELLDPEPLDVPLLLQLVGGAAPPAGGSGEVAPGPHPLSLLLESQVSPLSAGVATSSLYGDGIRSHPAS